MENGKTKKWESGNNHVFDGPKIHQILRNIDVVGHIANRENNDILEIGSFAMNDNRILFDGTNEERNLKKEKSKITYFKSKDELRYH